ncbi:MAG: head-tail connector protein, partial [Candidatus Gastranaerophilales bacterium]|nr:head-tail connector protein [Candidatus Gastranaerophilales bacterium]
AMLVNTFEAMKLEDEMEKIVDSVVETGEVTLFVGWETKTRKTRRAITLKEQLEKNTDKNFVIEDKVIYDNAKVKFISYEDFVFDRTESDNWDSCAKIYRTYQTLDEIKSNKSNNLLNEEKLEMLKGVVAKKSRKNNNKLTTYERKIEVLEYWGDIELPNGEILKNKLIVLAGRCVLVRFEDNPFIINPFIHANIIENPATGRGISPLRVALILNNISSTILNKQLDALALMMNPPYLAPKGCFKGEQDIHPGKIIEYDASLMTSPPTPIAFDKAMQGWEFLNYFKSTIESATGIFKNMAGNLQAAQRTATELNYSVGGQEARLNMILESINRKVIVPMIEKTAEIISNFKLGKESVLANDRGRTFLVEIDDNVRKSSYVYRYGDRKATFERKARLKELFEVVQSFLKIDTVSKRIDWLECFKFAMEQYGIENANNFLIAEPEQEKNNQQEQTAVPNIGQMQM